MTKEFIISSVTQIPKSWEHQDAFIKITYEHVIPDVERTDVFQNKVMHNPAMKEQLIMFDRLEFAFLYVVGKKVIINIEDSETELKK